MYLNSAIQPASAYTPSSLILFFPEQCLQIKHIVIAKNNIVDIVIYLAIAHDKNLINVATTIIWLSGP